MYAGARGSIVRRISSLSFSQVASSSTNARGNRPQAFGHTLGRFTFTDKRIGARREGGLLTGVQMADENNDQRSRTGLAEFIQSLQWARCGGANPNRSTTYLYD